MKSLPSKFLHQERALLLLSMLASSLVFFRILYFMDGSCATLWEFHLCPRLRFLFLGWNLLLAWIPLGLLYLLPYVKGRYFLQGTILLLWLLFFPNSPYLMTDLIHLRVRPEVPLWFDAFLLFTFAYLGLWLGIRALDGLRIHLKREYSLIWANGFTVLTLLLSGLGIYLGRVLRWNSWDALVQPSGPILDAIDLFQSPIQNSEAWLMIIVFTLIFSSVYYSAILGKEPDHQKMKSPD